LNNWPGLKQVIKPEPKRGVEPSAAYLVQVLNPLQQNPAKMVIAPPIASPSGATVVWMMAGTCILAAWLLNRRKVG